jgi:hypothetical protein
MGQLPPDDSGEESGEVERGGGYRNLMNREMKVSSHGR